MQDAEQHPPAGTGRWIKILLAGSLALNLAVAGLVAGAVIRHDGPMDRTIRSPSLGAFGAPYMLALPREDRRAVLRAMRSSQGGDVPSREMRRAVFQEVLTSLRATPFDSAQLQAVVARQATITVDVQKRAQSAWLELVEGMTDAERADYADAVEDVLNRGPKRR